ncbi:hypothetical protein [Pelagicoccus sp. SDUM812003]|uniref:hypothetical protein n=1 Tax=Pelagicoccus sp. SDUM812003 TaxID=3041267 RepID=UPI00280C937C|nr:hypothetical protein [Pelagicoccus sp. SDUM812003]MDQ8205718.1 hypothetical protein [Pelagicoccus sp. SDUM812003]
MGKELAKALSEADLRLNRPRQDHLLDSRINQRWEQLYELEKESALSALQYLFLTNAGGAVATLAFIGTSGVYKIGLGSKFALAFFVLGVIFSGISRAKQFHHLNKVFKNWRRLVSEFRSGKKTWNEINEEDEKLAVSDFFDYAFPYASFICFILGALIGFFTLIQ